MKKYLLGSILCLLFVVNICAQNTFRVMFYNVENLFDCEKDSAKNDDDFLPESTRAWNYNKYKDKLNKISQVIAAVGEWEIPALVGLCEVENDNVMKDLTEKSPLKEYGYKYLVTDSPDHRGIDVALMWQRDRFRMLDHRSVTINFEDKNRKPTRDILHVTGLLQTGDSLDVFVCHMPSRSNGEKETEPNRLFAASVLKNIADSICSIRKSPNILIMGDFNDYPQNNSIVSVLGARVPENSISNCSLYNLMADKGEKTGTYNYRGEWGILDHVIVSGRLLLNKSGFHTSNDKARICDLLFLLTEDEKYGGLTPFRTYYGPRYVGGYSDHLPVVLDFLVP